MRVGPAGLGPFATPTPNPQSRLSSLSTVPHSRPHPHLITLSSLSSPCQSSLSVSHSLISSLSRSRTRLRLKVVIMVSCPCVHFVGGRNRQNQSSSICSLGPKTHLRRRNRRRRPWLSASSRPPPSPFPNAYGQSFSSSSARHPFRRWSRCSRLPAAAPSSRCRVAVASPLTSCCNGRRKKVIGLDDLLTDHLKQQNEKENPNTKKAKKDACSYDDDDEDLREAYLTKLVEKCENQLNDFGEEEDIPLWGVKVFGDKKTFSPLEFPELGSCNLLQSFLNSELNSVVELAAEKGDNFLEGLLINGWLPKLAFLCGHIEKPVAIWSFNTMLYSSNEELRNSSSDFWSAVLSSRKEVDQLPVEIGWFPEYSDLRTALDTYGFLFEFSSSGEPKNLDSDTGEPPQNIRAWLKFVTACCLIRSKRPVFSVVEAEELVEIIICLFLDRQFQGLLVLLNDCMQAIVNYFTDQEWHSSCGNVAKFVASRVSKDLNCIQSVECIPVASSRCKQLKSAVAYQNLLSCFNGFLCQANSGEDILRLLRAINFKDKSCDFFKMYIHLVLTENWVLSNSLIEDNPVIYEMFCLLLRQCSSLISATDLRSYASKVRHRAAYLMHFSIYK
ncbi:uncharacterized protein DS421_12g372440 [Arachis hypogaea]|nr:uncharacterized protein DS421_12g372440 [Arachis hypogaea]